jgi:hypothetical protein
MIKHKKLFIAGAIILFLYGLLWFVIPSIGLNLHGHDTTATDLASVIARYWGSAFLGFGVILWLARKGDDASYGVRAIIWGGLVLCITGLVAAIIDKLVASPNALIWLSIVLYAFFSVWFAILAFQKPK